MKQLKSQQQFHGRQTMVTFRTEITGTGSVQLNFIDSNENKIAKGEPFTVSDVNDLYLNPRQKYCFVFDESEAKVFISDNAELLNNV